MEYRAVGNRVAVDFESLKLPLSQEKILEILIRKGFKVVEVDLISLARQCIVTSKYRRGARLYEAPSTVDCSSFTKWLYGECGIWLPRRSIQQREFGEEINLKDIRENDLIFVSGWIDYYNINPKDGVGHVGIVSNNKTVIHAANSKVNVTESSITDFVSRDKFRGARRYMPNSAKVITLETPIGREVEIADDIKWIISQSFS